MATGGGKRCRCAGTWNEGRRRWLGLLAATLALPGCVSMGPRPEPGRPCRRTGTTGAKVAARTEAPPRWWTAFEDAELDALAERALAGNLTLAQAAQRLRRRAPCRVPARPRPCRSACTRRPAPAQVVWSARRERAVRRRSRAGRITAGAGRTVHRLLPGRFRRPLGTRPVRPHRRRHGRGAREHPAPPKPTCARARVSVAAGPCAPISELRGARQHRVLSGLLDDQRHLLALVGAQARRHRQRFRCGPRQRAGSRNGRPAAAVSATGAAARAASGSAYWKSQIAPGLLASPASLPRGETDRAAAGRYRARPAGHPSRRNNRYCRPRPNYGCRSPSDDRP